MLSQWATLAPVPIAVVALGVAIWALLRLPSDTPPSPSAQQVADAKGRACAAYTTVHAASRRGAMQNDLKSGERHEPTTDVGTDVLQQFRGAMRIAGGIGVGVVDDGEHVGEAGAGAVL